MLAMLVIVFSVLATTQTKATPLKLTNTEGVESSVTLKGFDEQSRKIQIEKDGKIYDYSLSDLQLLSKIKVLRSSEMQEVLEQKAQLKNKSALLYGFVGLLIIVLALVIAFPTFQGSAFLITGQEGTGMHFKAWVKILALIGLIVGIRIAVLGGITWTDVIVNGLSVFRPEDGLVLVFIILGSIGLIKHHYSERLQLAATTAGVHFIFFSLVMAGILWLIWKWNGSDWTIPADEMLTRLILQPFELV